MKDLDQIQDELLTNNVQRKLLDRGQQQQLEGNGAAYFVSIREVQALLGEISRLQKQLGAQCEYSGDLELENLNLKNDLSLALADVSHLVENSIESTPLVADVHLLLNNWRRAANTCSQYIMPSGPGLKEAADLRLKYLNQILDLMGVL